ncbi:MAG TPA: radical SAM family heme chaperone HemW [Acidimicrobiales bacterium]|nr:radical SAM family heme chaperone HemW [Acidimicrobiales bacterium]
MPFGVYVHIPVCARRCDYCAFATWTDRHHLIGPYVDACRAELDGLSLPPATSVFVGGGTPSLVPPALLAALVRTVHVAPGAEVTVECNPESLTPALVEALVRAGVTRLSFGVQSMVAHVLTGLGRLHDPEAARRAVALAREAEVSCNVDLIFGGSGESDADWERTLDDVVAMGVPHVSAYALTVEPGTPLAADAARHPDEDVQASRYLVAEEVLTAAGLRNYEISNWARPGSECRHNQLYWEQGNYRGIGCAAHSHDEGRRWWNVRTPERYIDAVASGRSPEAGCDELDRVGRNRERLELSLRTRAGVPAAAVGDLEMLVDEGIVALEGSRAVLTPRGRLIANEVAVRLIVPG